LKSLKIAEEALLDLKEFSLSGGKLASLRAMVNKAVKLGMQVHRYDRRLRADPSVDEQLEAISQEWLSEKRLGEMGFTLGRFLIYPQGADLPRVAYALTRLHTSGGLLRLLFRR
jgi:lysylphosphatidylglycerol synthetase-like protein (DUF2156 family)